MGQQLMLRINQQTTFDEVHQWISNYFNSTYASADEDKATLGNVNETEVEQYDEWKEYYNEETREYNEEDVKYIVGMLNKGKGKRKGKGKGGKDKGGKDKTVTCYTCGQKGTYLPIAQ
eukprot:3922980-Amphidinium_carterae.1